MDEALKQLSQEIMRMREEENSVNENVIAVNTWRKLTTLLLNPNNVHVKLFPHNKVDNNKNAEICQ